MSSGAGAALLMAGSMLSLLLRAAFPPSIVRQPLFVAGLLRLTRFMNAARLAAALVFHFVIAHCARIVLFTLHSGIYLLPFKWDGGVAPRVAIYVCAV